MAVRGIRGATTAAKNSKLEIVEVTKELLGQLLLENALRIENIASVLFTTTPGLNAEFPAVAAREVGWTDTPLMCMQEIDVPEGLKNCIRVLLTVNTEKKQNEMVHIYLREARKLRK